MPAGRRSTRTREQRIEQLKRDVNRSGLTGEEIFQILVDWYGYREAVLYNGMVRQTITNSMTQRDYK